MGFRVLPSDESPAAGEILFECSDGVNVVCTPDVLKSCGGFFDEICGSPDPVSIPTTEFDSDIVMLFLGWAEYHSSPEHPAVKIPCPLSHSEPLSSLLDSFDQSFVYGSLIESGDETNNSKLLAMTRLAFFFDVADLQHLTCATLADLIKSKETQDEMRALFRISEPFTQQDWAALRREIPWAFDPPNVE